MNRKLKYIKFISFTRRTDCNIQKPFPPPKSSSKCGLKAFKTLSSLHLEISKCCKLGTVSAQAFLQFFVIYLCRKRVLRGLRISRDVLFDFRARRNWARTGMMSGSESSGYSGCFPKIRNFGRKSNRKVAFGFFPTEHRDHLWTLRWSTYFGWNIPTEKGRRF